MLGYAIFIAFLAVFAHNALLLFWHDKDASIYGRLRGLNKWILDLNAFPFFLVTFGAGFAVAFLADLLNVVGVFFSIAVAAIVLKDLAVINKARKAK